MSELNPEEIKKIASLANLNLPDKELEKLAKELSEVIDYNVAQLSKVETEKVEPLLNVSGLTNRYRDDFTEPGLTTAQVLQNTKSKHNGFFKVKQILDQT